MQSLVLGSSQKARQHQVKTLSLLILGLEGKGTDFASRTACGMVVALKNPKRRHMQGSGQQHIHPPSPHCDLLLLV